MPPGDSSPGKRDFSEEAPSPDPSSSDNKKRRTAIGSTSSRGVANLTPDQLAKKRANDREAQRAIRERTKTQIENLEKRIRELTAQQPYQELQHVLRQKELVEAENADIKKRLATVLSLIEPILGQHALQAAPYAASTAPSPYIPDLARPSPFSNPNASTPNTTASPSLGGPHGATTAWQAPSAAMGHEIHQYRPTQSTPTQKLAQQKHEMSHNLDMGPEKLGLAFLLDGSQRTNKIPNGINGFHETGSIFQQISRDSDRESSIHGGSSSTASYNSPSNGFEMTGHAAPIRNGPPTCPLDSLLLDFLHERQQQAADGVATPKLVGPAYPSVSSLLNPACSVHSHPLSKVFTDILATFPELSTIPEKVAVLYIMFLVMRWQISPTQENYDRLPDWITPRPSQLFTPHPAWIDLLPWPKMRDRLVREYNPRDYLFDDWFIPYTTTMSVNWPYEPTDALLSSPDSEDLMINPVFERHLRRLENWSLGPAFANAFPGLVDTYRLKHDGERRV
ncbi:hypothetical protein D0Z07_5843 [Hyphodiscus hymeniophilus]|uniref:BZIP transcription factor n=1 Tax=Hyphodiscus hymeniophilus TaxID=353542 RepID=A0A9P6VI53_9HELO|nr:hypothetical protein D0Z07_5843 [Hyphodiscus hymeniophilus]